MTNDLYSLKSALAQIDNCSFECEAGPLSQNAGWLWLKRRIANGPLFFPGQGVYYKVVAEVHGVKLEKWSLFTVVGCCMGSSTDGITWTYSISRDAPSAYHYGGTPVHGIKESELSLSSDGAPTHA